MKKYVLKYILAQNQGRGYNGLVAMPTVLRVGAYRFFFYAGDRGEPMHVHVERDDKIAKFWLDPVRLDRSGGFGRSEIRKMQRIIKTHRTALERAWNEYFNC